MSFNNPLSSLFGKSPITPMQEHMTAVVSCAALLPDFFRATYAGDWTQAEDVYNQICTAEHKADDLKKKLRLQLPKSLFMPVSRSDLLELLSVQDHIANRAKDIAGLMLGRKMRVPSELKECMQQFVDTAVSAARQALKAINELDELLEAGFIGREVDFVEELIEQLHALENNADNLEREIRHKLFALESSLPPVDVMFLYKIIEYIGGLADRAERVGGRLQLLLAR